MGDVFEEGRIPLAFVAAGTVEHEQLEDLVDAAVHFGWRNAAAAVLDSAGPVAHHSHAVLAEQTVAARALQGVRSHNELAQAANENVKGRHHARCFVYLRGTRFNFTHLSCLEFII